MWIIHPEPSLSEQKRIWRVYTRLGMGKRMFIWIITTAIWFKTPKKMTEDRIIYFRTS